MIQVLISGFILGLTLAVLIGPSFFSLLQTSVHRGFRVGMYVAIGIFLSDFTLVSLSFLGVSQLISNDKYRVPFGIVGGLILIGYGAITFRKKIVYDEEIEENKDEAEDEKIKNKIHAPKPILYIIKGYFLNLINPFLLIFWVGVMSFVTAEYNNSKTKFLDIVLFFGTALVTVFLTDLLKCFVANQIKRFLKPKLLTKVNHGLGISLFIFGLWLIVKTLLKFYFNLW